MGGGVGGGGGLPARLPACVGDAEISAAWHACVSVSIRMNETQNECQWNGAEDVTGNPILALTAHNDVVHVAHGFAAAGPRVLVAGCLSVE